MGLLRTAARASVATRVIGNTHRRQQQRWAAEDAARPAQQQTAAPTSDLIGQLTQLGQLRDQGILTEQEFQAQKQRLLG